MPASELRLPHPLSGADPLTLWRLPRAYGGVDRAAWGRYAGFVAASLARAPLSLVEALVHRALPQPTAPAPWIVLGHWRSGTTHLVNLLSQAPRFGYLGPIAAGLPHDMLLLGRALAPFARRILPAHRAIDAVAVTPTSPQEDEIPLSSMGAPSFYHGVYFPRHFADTVRAGVFLPDAAEAARWRRCFTTLLAKQARLMPGRTLLIKNPVYTARLAELAALCPEARFVHIHRDPRTVYRSTVRFYRTLLDQFALQDTADVPVERVVVDSYRAMMQRFAAERAALAPERIVDLAYRDLIAEPLATLEALYTRFGLSGFAADAPRYRGYLNSIAGYTPAHKAPPPLPKEIETALAPFIARYGEQA